VSDAAIRELERAAEASPGDRRASFELGRALARAGLGWHKEPVPQTHEFQLDPEQRGVYAILLHDGRTRIEFVYVPRGYLVCDDCGGKGRHYGDSYGTECEACSGGAVQIDPFYMGRYPVTVGQWIGFRPVIQTHPVSTDARWPRKHHPVTEALPEDAEDFCRWSSCLSLPTRPEWTYAAYCQENAHLIYGTDSSGRELCVKCNEPAFGTPRCRIPSRRPHPWGFDSPDRIIFEGRGDQVCAALDDHYRDTGPAPVVTTIFHPENEPTTRLEPARPLGASWCGMQDAVGNVAQIVQGGMAMGGSFRSPYFDGPGFRGPITRRQDDVGFRVVLRPEPTKPKEVLRVRCGSCGHEISGTVD
jgi:hypothetical protein